MAWEGSERTQKRAKVELERKDRTSKMGNRSSSRTTSVGQIVTDGRIDGADENDGTDEGRPEGGEEGSTTVINEPSACLYSSLFPALSSIVSFTSYNPSGTTGGTSDSARWAM